MKKNKTLLILLLLSFFSRTKIFFLSSTFDDLWRALGRENMILINHVYREQGIIFSNQLIFRCPKCQTFAISVTRPFVNLKRFCQFHHHGGCWNGLGAIIVIL